MHEDCNPLPDHGTITCKLLAWAIFTGAVLGLFIVAGFASAVEVLDLRARVEALEKAMAPPIRIEIEQFEGDFSQSEQFEVPPLEPRNGGVY